MLSRRAVNGLFAATAASLVSSCGTILYPDRSRHNQGSHGNIDPGVVAMDAAMCIFFLIPGLIAFAVDFSTGAIYYPARSGKERTIFDRADYKGKIGEDEIEQFVRNQTGVEDFKLEEATVLTAEMDSIEQFAATRRQLERQHLLASN